MNRLNKAGCLRPGYKSSSSWWVDGERVAYIHLRAEASRLILTYRVRQNGGDWVDVEEAVPLTWSPCRFGGTRPYFLCPGVVHGLPCRRRVTKIYGGGRYFLCRYCYNLAYASQSERRHDRLVRRARKRRAALGEEPGTFSSVPLKPKGMHSRTYERYLDEIYAAEAQADLAFLKAFSSAPRRSRSQEK